MDLKEIKQVVDLMKKSDLTEFEIEQEGLKLKIKRVSDTVPVAMPVAAPVSGGSRPPMYAAEPAASAVAAPLVAFPTAVAAPVEDAGVTYIKSPMVGTFYRSPSPDSPAFVEIGAKVQENTVVCILEAMKIMNEIQGEVKGTILEALIENGQPVEFGQKLFKVKSA